MSGNQIAEGIEAFFSWIAEMFEYHPVIATIVLFFVIIVLFLIFEFSSAISHAYLNWTQGVFQ